MTPWTAAHQASLSFTVSLSLFKFLSIVSDAVKISSSATLFSFCLQSFPASGSFPMNQLFASGSQSIGASALALVLPMHICGWFPSGRTGLISLQSKGLSRVFSSTTVVWCSVFFVVHLSLLYVTIGKTLALTIQSFVVLWDSKWFLLVL